MVKRIIYISLAFIVFSAVIAGILISQLNSGKRDSEPKIIDIVDDHLVNYSEGREKFNINCAACHRVGGINDPDFLINLGAKLDKDYFHLFITKQDSLIINGAKYQTEIGSYTDFSHVAISHTFINLNKKDTDEIYEYIIAAYSK